jgi:RNA polymerase-binding transcription factor
MTHSRHTELKEMLEARRAAIQDQVQQKIRAFRDMAGAERPHLSADLLDDPTQKDLDFALVEMQSQALENITIALARLRAGEYGICHECEEEIPEKRLHALPFATRCLACQESVEHIRLLDRRIGQRRPPFAAIQ